MQRIHLLAAEIFAYSYANYSDHLPAGSYRFSRYMPEDVRALEKAESEKWSDERVARVLKIDAAEVPDWRERLARAKAVVDAPDAAASFRAGVRFSIEDAVREGLGDAASIERLVTQVCYRAADMAFLLEREGRALADYSQALRWEPEDVDPADEENA